jgi:hypothetical protein
MRDMFRKRPFLVLVTGACTKETLLLLVVVRNLERQGVYFGALVFEGKDRQWAEKR